MTVPRKVVCLLVVNVPSGFDATKDEVLHPTVEMATIEASARAMPNLNFVFIVVIDFGLRLNTGRPRQWKRRAGETRDQEAGNTSGAYARQLLKAWRCSLGFALPVNHARSFCA